jgi:hypothetical protein
VELRPGRLLAWRLGRRARAAPLDFWRSLYERAPGDQQRAHHPSGGVRRPADT